MYTKTPPLPHYLAQTKDWQLQLLHDSSYCKSFALSKYQGRAIMSTLLHFFSNHIVITGDVRPAGNGVISVPGYGLEWFASDLAPDYLAEKFLPTNWHMELSIDWWKDQLAQAEEELKQQGEELDFPYTTATWRIAGEPFEGNLLDTLRRWVAMLETEPDIDARWMYENSPEHKRGKGWRVYFQSDNAFGGMGHDPNAVGWLYAIQHRFAECWKEIDSEHD